MPDPTKPTTPPNSNWLREMLARAALAASAASQPALDTVTTAQNPFLTTGLQQDSFVSSDSSHPTQYNVYRIAEQVKQRSQTYTTAQAALASSPDDPAVRTAYEIAQNAFTNLNNILIDMIKFMREINNAWNNVN